MKSILTIRNHIVTFYRKHEMICNYFLRLVFSFLTLFAIRSNIGFNTLLSQLWFIIGFSVVCAFISIRFLVLVMAVYVVLEAATLSIGVGVVMLIIFAIIYLCFLRLDSRYGFVLMLFPLLYIIRIPAVIPLILGIIAPMNAIGAVIAGNVVYFIIHYLSINATVIAGYTDASEFTRANMYLNGMFNYKELFSSTLIVILVFMVVFYMRKLNFNHARDMAAAIGAGLYVVLMLIVRMILNTISFSNLRTIIIGTVVALIITVLADKFISPLDFSRSEMLEFEDSEYYYYVKAVPKITIDKETVSVTRISSRKDAGNAILMEPEGAKEAAEEAEGKEDTD